MVTGADPVGVGGGPGGGAPLNFIKREKTLCACTRKHHILVLNSYLDPPFRNLLYPPLGHTIRYYIYQHSAIIIEMYKPMFHQNLNRFAVGAQAGVSRWGLVWGMTPVHTNKMVSNYEKPCKPKANHCGSNANPTNPTRALTI